MISNDRLYLYYFTHPGRIGEDRAKDGYEQRRTSIQVVELELNSEGWITADRNRPTYVLLFPEEPVRAALAIDARHSRPISEELFGIFFEDINYAADGGLYAELVQNRSFEYSPEDLAGRGSAWNPKHSWRMITEEEPGPSAGVRLLRVRRSLLSLSPTITRSMPTIPGMPCSPIPAKAG